MPAPKREIVFGTDRDYAPFEFLDAKGQPAGFNIDLMRAMGEVMGWEVSFRLDRWSLIRRALEVERTVDVSDMFRTRERAEVVDFADPFAVVYHEIFIRLDSPPIGSLDELHGKELIVQDGAFAQELIERMDIGVRLVPVASEPDALRLLASGRHDCALVGQIAGRYAIRRHKLENLISTGPRFFPWSIVTLSSRGGPT